MKKALAGVAFLFMAVVIGIGLWYWGYTSRAQAQADDYAQWVQQQKLMPVEIVVRSVPDNTPTDQPLYLSGSAITLGNWEAAGVPLQRQPDGTYRVTVELMSGITHAFKVTRGTWGTVEKGPGGADMPDRTIEVQRPQQVLEIEVASWVDEGRSIPNRQTLTGDIRLHRKFRSEILNNERDFIVYLPPGYDDDDARRYPVLYLQDGQNLMNEATAYAGVEWRIDETAQRLLEHQAIEPVIIVGVYNTDARSAEFMPPSAGSPAGTARGDDYARMLVTELKPFVDERYRTMTGPEKTGIGGSGLGGLIALHTVRQYPDAFGRVALLTPFLRAGDQPILQALGEMAFLKGKRIWIDMGTESGGFLPGDDPAGDARALVAAIERAGVQQGRELRYRQIDGIAHGEALWAERVGPVLTFLYPPDAAAAPEAQP